jgi:PPK2 family polyphosphate:nucleotide phosphotransferase
MHVTPLAPVKPGARLALRDADAEPPDDLPDKEEREAETARLLERLSELQAALFADGRHALLIVLQGRDASGKDGTIRTVFGACNPQGCEVTSFREPTHVEQGHDFLWRVHQRVPARGMIGIFNRSHYEDVLVVRVHGLAPRKVWAPRYRQINDFERMLVESGVVILKFFLHVSRDEQEVRLRERLEDPEKNWKFRQGDLDDRDLWPDYTRAYRDALAKCSTPWAPWYVVPADRKKVRNLLIARTLVDALQRLRPRYPAADEKVLKLAEKIV